MPHPLMRRRPVCRPVHRVVAAALFAACVACCARAPRHVSDLQGTWVLARPPAEPAAGRAPSFRVDADGRVLLPGQRPAPAVLFGDTLFVSGQYVASGGIRMLVHADSLVLLSDGSVYRRAPLGSRGVPRQAP